MSWYSEGRPKRHPDLSKNNSLNIPMPKLNTSNWFSREMHSQFRGVTPILTKSEKSQKFDDFFKIIVVGPPNAGKTSLIRQFCYQEFEEDPDGIGSPTFGMQNHTKRISYGDLILQLSFWDSPSDERFLTQINFHISSSDAVLFVYDCNDPESLDELKQLLEELSSSLNESEAILYLISTKKDKRQAGVMEYIVPKSIMEKYKLKYASTSSKVSSMTNELLEQLVGALVAKRKGDQETNEDLKQLRNMVQSVAEDRRNELDKRREMKRDEKDAWKEGKEEKEVKIDPKKRQSGMNFIVDDSIRRQSAVNEDNRSEAHKRRASRMKIDAAIKNFHEKIAELNAVNSDTVSSSDDDERRKPQHMEVGSRFSVEVKTEGARKKSSFYYSASDSKKKTPESKAKKYYSTSQSPSKKTNGKSNVADSDTIGQQETELTSQRGDRTQFQWEQQQQPNCCSQSDCKIY